MQNQMPVNTKSIVAKLLQHWTQFESDEIDAAKAAGFCKFSGEILGWYRYELDRAVETVKLIGLEDRLRQRELDIKKFDALPE